MVYIDGSLGEGGGQVLRTSLSLSMITGTALHIDNIRARRRKPGLMRQHMTAVKAAEEICGARVDGDFAGSTELEFKPGRIRHGNYSFAIGTAGSATLVLQTVLPALLFAEGESNLTLEGGTHNPLAPPYDFLERTFLPLLRRMGATVDVSLVRHGFFPAGGGKVKIRIQGGKLSPLSLLKRGGEVKLSGCCIYSGLPESVATREADALRRRLSLADSQCRVRQVESAGPGNVVMVDVRDEKGDHTEVFTAFGEKALRAEKVADAAGSSARLYAASTAVLGKHSADQILLPLALAGSGEFSTLPLTEHSKTNMQVIESFLPVKFDHQTDDYSVCTVTCRDKG